MERLAVTRTGLPGVSELPWGSHLCLFYETGQDLVEILVPFGMAGLENGEACILMACDTEVLRLLEQRLRAVIPDYEARTSSKQLQILRPQDSYVPGGRFDAERAMRYWIDKVRDARERGYPGLRANGDQEWLAPHDWSRFQHYEEALGAGVAGERGILLCAYGLDDRSGGEVFEIVHSHQMVLAKRGGKWEALEAAELGQTRQQLQALRADLEWRVLQRTEQLTAANERLRREMAERTRIERALRESETRFRVAFESTPLMTSIARIDDGRIIDANQAFLRTFEYERAELIGRTSLELGLWVDNADRERVIEAMSRSGSMLGYPFRARTKSRRELDLLGFAVNIEIDGQRCALVASLDMTARRRAEKAVLEQQWLLNESERLTGTGSWRWTMETGEVMWSPEMFRIHGQDPERFSPTLEKWVDLVHPEDRAAAFNAFERALTTEGSFSIEHRIVRPDGSIRTFRGGGYSKVPGSEGKQLVGYGSDVTDSREAEEMARTAAANLAAMARKLVEVQESERRRLARELHDRVGQNLTALGLNLDAISRQLASQAKLDGRDTVLARLEDCTALLESTSEAVSDVAAEMRPPMLDDLGLMAALKWYARAFSERTALEVAIRGLDEPRRLAPACELAAFRIVQEALMNVAEHARAQNVEITFEADGAEGRLSVCDDGIGPQVAPTGRADQGLGLITMKERAIAAGGRFEFGPRPGGGTCVVVTLPRS